MAPESQAPTLRRNALAVVVGRGASAVLWLVATPYVLARLGAERFAVWSLFFAFSGYVASIDFGMANSVARFVALSSGRGDRESLIVVIRRSLALSAGMGCVWCVACILLRHSLAQAFHVPAPLAPEVERSLGVFALSLLAYLVAQVLNGALNGFRRIDLATTCFLAGLVANIGVLVVGLRAGGGLVTAAAAAVTGQVASALLAAVLVVRELRRVAHGETTPVTWKDLLHFGGAVQITSMLSMGQFQTGKVLLPVLGRLVWLTPFELAFRVASTLWSLPVLVWGSVMPSMAHASASGIERMRELYGWACRWSFALGGTTCAGLWLLAPAVLTAWLGPGHAGSVPVVRVLALGFGLATLAGPATVAARGGGWPWLETLHFAMAFVLNLAIAWWAIPRFGPLGTAVALGVSYAVAGTWLVIVMHRRLQVANGVWLARLALPRVLGPVAAAAILGLAWPVGAPVGRGAALAALALHGLAFAALSTLLTWPTGDARRMLDMVRGRLRRRARVPDAAAQPEAVAGPGGMPR